MTRRAGHATVALWLGSVTAIAVVRAIDPARVSVRALACSPEAMAAGRVWTLATSGFLIAGPPVPVLMTGIVALAVVRLAGPGTWWLSAVGGRFGTTFLAYAGIAAVYATDRASAKASCMRPTTGCRRSGRPPRERCWCAPSRRRAPTGRLAACTVALLGRLSYTPRCDTRQLADVEHLLAFVLGLPTAAVRVSVKRAGNRGGVPLPARPQRARPRAAHAGPRHSLRRRGQRGLGAPARSCRCGCASSSRLRTRRTCSSPTRSRCPLGWRPWGSRGLWRAGRSEHWAWRY